MSAQHIFTAVTPEALLDQIITEHELKVTKGLRSPVKRREPKAEPQPELDPIQEIAKQLARLTQRERGLVFAALNNILCPPMELTEQVQRYWESLIDTDMDRVVVKGEHYQILPEPKPEMLEDSAACRRLASMGREYVIQFFDGRRVVSHNLGAQGEIPPQYRDRLPDNAFFVRQDQDGSWRPST